MLTWGKIRLLFVLVRKGQYYIGAKRRQLWVRLPISFVTSVGRATSRILSGDTTSCVAKLSVGIGP